jgi:GT2 family glycosyltransferase
VTDVDVLIPTRGRPAALAATLAGLAGQSAAERAPGFSVVVSDQSDDAPAWADPAVAAMVRILRHRGVAVRTCRHLPRRGLAEQRAFLLSQADAPRVLFLDDDIWLEPNALDRLLAAIRRLRCGFVGMAVQGLSYVDDRRPHEQGTYEEWPDGEVRPERVRRGSRAWERWRLHNAANLVHLAAGLDLTPGEWRAYKVAWVGGCVLYERAALEACGGFDFWSALPPEHAGEDVVVQLRVMERFGGAGVVPSGAVHLELPTTVPDRRVNAYDAVLDQPPPGLSA